MDLGERQTGSPVPTPNTVESRRFGACQVFLRSIDGIVDIQDITFSAGSFGSRPRDLRWNPIADVDSNGQINIIDLVMVAADYGKTS